MVRFYILFVVLFFSKNSAAQEVPLKRLYLGNDTHVDLMYNGTEEKWAQLILEMGEFYLKLGESTSTLEPRKRSKWNYDCAYWLWVFEHRTSPEYFQRIIAQIKNQQASVPYNFTLPIYGASTPEAIVRSFYYSGYLQRKYGIDVELAVCQENATIPLGLTSLFAGSGAKYSWKGVCNCATKTLTIGCRKHEIYWNRGLDGQQTLMKWYSNFGWNAELGGYAEMLEPTVAVIQMDTLCGSARYPYRIAGAFGRGWDNMVNYAYDVQWGIGHRTRPGTEVHVSNELDFFRDFETIYGQKLPAQTLAYGNEWDLLPATMMNVSGSIRRSLERLRNAEALAAIVSLHDKSAFSSLDSLKKDAFYAISVISAHGWTIDGPITKDQFATWARIQEQRVTTYTDSLHHRAVRLMGKVVTVAPSTSALHRFFVFNALNWPRTDFVDVPFDGPDGVQIRELATDTKILFQQVVVQGKKYLRFTAKDIPPTGYKTYEIVSGPSPKGVPKAFKWAENTLETPYYRVKMANSGAIMSLIDKKTNQEYAQNIDGRYLNSLGTETEGSIRIENEGSQSITLVCTGDKPLRHTSRLTFYRDLPRIDIANQIQENFGAPTYWSFSFKVQNPDIWHEEVGAVVKAKYEDEGGHYARAMSRTDHLSLNHFADVSNEKGGITLSDLDCLFMRVGNSTPQQLDSQSPQINVLAGGQVDANFNLGILKQAGDTLFHQHFALFPHSGPYDQAAAMRSALEHQNPLVCGTAHVGANSKSQHSFFQTNQPNLLLWALKPGEAGGIAARYWNMGAQPVEAKWDSPTFNVSKAQQATHVETPTAPLPIANQSSVLLRIQSQEMKTFLFEFKNVAQ